MKHMEILRRKLVYELFIEQFIEMAQVSIKYRALEQTMSLLKQADRLCLLLCDDKFNEEAEAHKKIVETLRKTVETLVDESALASSPGPALPRRESLADKEAIKIRFRPEKLGENNYTTIDGPSKIEEVPSDDDNDEIYNYHQSVFAQIHATSDENLARFQHQDERDDIEETTNSIARLELKLKNDQHSDYESDSATQI